MSAFQDGTLHWRHDGGATVRAGPKGVGPKGVLNIVQ